MSRRNRAFALGILITTAPAVRCASNTNDIGDETHFQCSGDADCKEFGSEYACVESRCTKEPANGFTVACDDGTGNTDCCPESATPGSGCSTEDAHCWTPCLNEVRGQRVCSGGEWVSGKGVVSCSADGGATPEIGCDDGSKEPLHAIVDGHDCDYYEVTGPIGLITCADYDNAGLADVSCGDAGPFASRPALAPFCEREDELGTLDRQFYGCARAAYELAPSPRLRQDLLCAPTARDTIIGCVEALSACERPPLCEDDGTSFGCPDIVDTCPGLSLQACRNSFDAREYAGRRRIEACLKNAADLAGTTCVDAFYRCSWGI
jgi:hypothetical protein